MSVTVGKTVPEFSLTGTGGNEVRVSDLRGKKLVLYFYPKDSTPGCTRESIDFGQKQKEFAADNVVIFGLSRDNLKSHEKFKDKLQLPFDLLSDEEEKVCRLFEVLKKKSMYGRIFPGIERSTFLIDEKGVLRREWRKVKVNGHVDEVLAAVKEM